MDEKRKILPISIILGFIILGFFIYKGIVEKQDSINYRQEKEYIGKRKMECYNILEREKAQAQHYSVIGAKYYEPLGNNIERNDLNDSCRVEYLYPVRNDDGTSGYVTDFKSY